MRKFTMLFYIFAAAITLQTIILAVTNLGTLVSEFHYKEKLRKVNLLILSTWRSGSSLVGQFFNQHPDVFFLKEPSWHVWKAMPQNKAHVLHMAVRDLIRSIFKCDMSVLDVYLQNRSHVSNLFQWSASRALCSPPACNAFSRKKILTKMKCRKECGISPFSKVEQSCNIYSHVVLQEFRIFDLKVLYSLLKDPTLNLKILHVVRDPRALAKSRQQIELELNFDNAVILNADENSITDTDREKVLKEICQSHADMYRINNVHPPSFLRDRYMLLRYDDLVRDPVSRAKEMYAFAGLKLTEELENWMHKMTHGQGLQNSQPFAITSRDALSVAIAWRHILTLEEISSVQQTCKDFMDVFRYQNIDSEDELYDFNLDTVLPRRKEDFQWYKYNEDE